MKILWLVNIMMPDLSEKLGLNKAVSGGWLSGALGAVRKSENDIVIVTTVSSFGEKKCFEINGVRYYVCERDDRAFMKRCFDEILKSENPDVVHIYGTEFVQSLVMSKLCEKEKTLVTIQGCMSYIKNEVNAGIPEKISRDNIYHKILRFLHKGGQSLQLREFSYEERASYEKTVLENTKYINGGSEWGNAAARSINPDCVTLDCNLLLRDSFYCDERWESEKCEKHTIYANCSYSVKGFHMLLEAMPIILKRFPDTKIKAVANFSQYRNYGGLRAKIMDKAQDYEWYLQRKIDKYGLRDHIDYLGYLNEAEVKNQLLKSNVFVSASSIENQSTSLGEAMILGVPSVASYVGAIPEMIDNGVDGFTYPFNETYILADSIIKIFENDELARQFSQKGHEHAARTYDREKNCRDLIKMYETIYNNERG